MTGFDFRSIGIVWGVLWLGLTGAACQIGPIEVGTNPPDFRQIPRDQIRTTMGAFSVEVQELERLLASSEKRSVESQRALVLSSLDRMERAAAELDQPGRTSQHPMIDRHLQRFVERVKSARRDVERDPPRYFLTGTVAGACFVCHGTKVASSDAAR